MSNLSNIIVKSKNKKKEQKVPIGNLIKKYDSFMNKMTLRRKIVSIFSEFDERARKDLESLM